MDPELRLSLADDEAYVYLMLGRPDSARALLEWSFTRRPAQRSPGFNGRARTESTENDSADSVDSV